MWSGRIRLTTAMLWVLGFFAIFVAGGLTGVMLAAVPLNTQMHDTFFVVAHFHYGAIGGRRLSLFGAFYYWYPNITGRMLSRASGNGWVLGLLFVGFNLTSSRCTCWTARLPRRIYTYTAALGWGTLNGLASAGAMAMALRRREFLLVDAVRAYASGAVAPDNPLEAGTLEGATSSTPPTATYSVPPTVGGRRAAVGQTLQNQPVIVGLRRTSPGRARHARPRRGAGSPHRIPDAVDLAVPQPRVRYQPHCSSGRSSRRGAWCTARSPCSSRCSSGFWPKSIDEGGTQPWPKHRTLPLPNQAPASGGRDMSEARTLALKSARSRPGAFGSRSLMWWGNPRHRPDRRHRLPCWR